MAGKGTPATVAAEKAGIVFVVHEYVHDPNAASYGLEAAEKLGTEPGRVFKTLVAQTDQGALLVAVVPVERQLDLKALASVAGARKTLLADAKDAERATGYVVGGISPLGQRRRLALFLDDSALAHETVLVSAGRRGLEIELAPADLLALAGGRAAGIAQ